MHRYKLREELAGATLFDTITGATTEVKEGDYIDILRGQSEKFSNIFSPGDYGENVRNFELYKITAREKLPMDSLSAPSKVYLEITRKCNLSCKNCYNKSNKADSKMSLAQAKKLIDVFSRNGVFELRITGGEPTTHPQLFQIIEYAEKVGLAVSLSTNFVFDQDTLNKIASSGVRTIITSLDGTRQYNDKIRGVGSFDKIISNIRLLREYNPSMLKLNMTLDKNNYKMVTDVARIAAREDVSVLNINPLKLTGRALQRKEITLSKEEMLQVLKSVSEIRKKYHIKVQTYFDILDEKENKVTGCLFNRTSCAAGIEVAAINPRGDVYGCVVSPGSGYGSVEDKNLFVAGNINDSDFMSIWLDSSKWKAYRDFSLNKCKDCLDCKHYSKNCFGNCIVTSYVHNGNLNAKDPYCFSDLLET
jgi:radical SAM protein with 4Fe4S-binding SPASM domain